MDLSVAMVNLLGIVGLRGAGHEDVAAACGGVIEQSRVKFVSGWKTPDFVITAQRMKAFWLCWARDRGRGIHRPFLQHSGKRHLSIGSFRGGQH